MVALFVVGLFMLAAVAWTGFMDPDADTEGLMLFVLLVLGGVLGLGIGAIVLLYRKPRAATVFLSVPVGFGWLMVLTSVRSLDGLYWALILLVPATLATLLAWRRAVAYGRGTHGPSTPAPPTSPPPARHTRPNRPLRAPGRGGARSDRPLRRPER